MHQALNQGQGIEHWSNHAAILDNATCGLPYTRSGKNLWKARDALYSFLAFNLSDSGNRSLSKNPAAKLADSTENMELVWPGKRRRNSIQLVTGNPHYLPYRQIHGLFQTARQEPSCACENKAKVSDLHSCNEIPSDLLCLCFCSKICKIAKLWVTRISADKELILRSKLSSPYLDVRFCINYPTNPMHSFKMCAAVFTPVQPRRYPTGCEWSSRHELPVPYTFSYSQTTQALGCHL